MSMAKNYPLTALSTCAQVVSYSSHHFDINFGSVLALIAEHFTPAKINTLKQAYTHRFDTPIIFPTQADEINLTFLMNLLNFNLGYHDLREIIENSCDKHPENLQNLQEEDHENDAGGNHSIHDSILYGLLNMYMSYDDLSALTLSKFSLEEISQFFRLSLDSEFKLAPAMYGYKPSSQRPLCEKLHEIIQSSAQRLLGMGVTDFTEYLFFTLSQNAQKSKESSANDLIYALIRDFTSFNDQIVLHGLTDTLSCGDLDENEHVDENNSKNDNVAISAIHIHYYSKVLQFVHELYFKFSLNNEDKSSKLASLLNFVDFDQFSSTPYANYSTFMLYTSYLIDITSLPPHSTLMTFKDGNFDDDENQDCQDNEESIHHTVKLEIPSTFEECDCTTPTQLVIHNPILTLSPHTTLSHQSTITTSLLRCYTAVITKILLSVLNHNLIYTEHAINSANYSSITIHTLLPFYNITPPQEAAVETNGAHEITYDNTPESFTFIELIPFFTQRMITQHVDMFDDDDNLLKLVSRHNYPPYISAFADAFLNNHTTAPLVSVNIFHYWADTIVREYPQLFNNSLIKMVVDKAHNPGYW